MSKTKAGIAADLKELKEKYASLKNQKMSGGDLDELVFLRKQVKWWKNKAAGK